MAAAAFTTGPLEVHIDLVKRIAETGVTAVVLTACQLATQDEDDRTWLTRVETLVSATVDTPLGMYEMPTPYHRLLGSLDAGVPRGRPALVRGVRRGVHDAGHG